MSIRRYLVLTLFSVLTLITFIAAIQGYKGSMSRAEKQFDQQLLDLAQTLLTMHAVSALTPTPSSQITSQVAQQGSFAFQIWKNQYLVVKSNNAPDHQITDLNLIDDKSGAFFEVNFLNQRWRALALSKQMTKDSASKISVIIAQPLKTQFALAQALILAAVTPMIIAIAILSVLFFIIITQGLKPLHHLRTELSQRKSSDFSPLALQVDNSELADVVTTLNQLFTRLDAAFQRERHFASDAAHELKTPLSVLKINMHNLIQDLAKRIKTSNPSAATTIEEFSSIQALSNSVDRMGHVIDQILNLNRSNSVQMLNASSCFNINILLKEVISELYSDILSKEQTIVLESADILLSAHEFSIHLLAVNLISNANKYTPIGGDILVSVRQESDHKVVLCVEDSGDGIEPQEYQRVFDRFYRVGGDQHNSSVMGCGLGLAIVKHITDLHGAKVQLSCSPILKGLKIEVIFPVVRQVKEQGND
tara:strand:- start:28123 stop:29556 length:1434 start_codon:yes stop_codon:yes gene_type:complete